jgi:homoserine O-succinyltransferase
LQTGLEPRIHVPHSRRNGLSEHELAAQGYRILSRLADGEVDSFARDMPGRSRFVFLQGHPEYGAETLGREYLRDVGRFLGGESGTRPAVPENYFDRATEMALAALDTGAEGSAGGLANYSRIISGALPLQSWHTHTIKFFGNWLTMIAAEKVRRLVQSQPPQRKKHRA